MPWPSRKKQFETLAERLKSFSRDVRQLDGINDRSAREALAWQMVASLRRQDYTRILMRRSTDVRRADPRSKLFDPERAAMLRASEGKIDEAIWLIFLATHFGKHNRTGWRRVADVYSGLGLEIWTWEKVSKKFPEFAKWYKADYKKIGGGFGNHRKYETLSPDSISGTLLVIESFIHCVGSSPSNWFRDLIANTGNDPTKIFDAAYKKLTIKRFGRLAKFDFLAMLGRMALAPISPGSTYLKEATGPLSGARLLIVGDNRSKMPVCELEKVLDLLGQHVNVDPQVMEDAICNWQKSPRKFKHFRG